jgi:hypothetical protein
MSYEELKTYKYSPEVRAAMALAQREYRKHKKEEAKLRDSVPPLQERHANPADRPIQEGCY